MCAEANNEPLVPADRVEQSILLIRGEKVIIDADLAVFFGVPTKALNQAVKRNQERFPRDFMFQLSQEEKSEVVTNCDHLGKLKFSKTLPFAFTEHGALMAANVLNSSQAVEMSIFIVRAFVRLRQMLASHADLARKIEALEDKYDRQFKIVFDAIRELMSPKQVPTSREIGFHTGVKRKSQSGQC